MSTSKLPIAALLLLALPGAAVAQEQGSPPAQAQVQPASPEVQVRQAQPNVQVQPVQPQVVVERAPGESQVKVERMNWREAALFDAGLDRQKLIGIDVVDRDGDDVGEVRDLILAQGGGIETVVVQTSSGFLGMNERLVAVPFTQVRVGQDGKQVRVGMSSDQMKEIPEFSYDGQRQAVVGPDGDGGRKPQKGQ